jgi:hypothetical protein
VAHQRQFSEAPLASVLHSPFDGLDESAFMKLHAKVLRLESSNRYKEALQVLEVLHDKSVDGLNYYQVSVA